MRKKVYIFLFVFLVTIFLPFADAEKNQQGETFPELAIGNTIVTNETNDIVYVDDDNISFYWRTPDYDVECYIINIYDSNGNELLEPSYTLQTSVKMRKSALEVGTVYTFSVTAIPKGRNEESGLETRASFALAGTESMSTPLPTSTPTPTEIPTPIPTPIPTASVHINYDNTFSFHGGLHFGMTKEEVIDFEKEKGTLSYAYDKDEEIVYLGEIAGIDGRATYYFYGGGLSDLSFQFGKEGGEDVYQLTGSAYLNQDNMDSDYHTLFESLTKKYGNSLGNKDGAVFLITGKAFDNYMNLPSIFGFVEDFKCDLCDYDEWFIESENSYVKIDLASYYFRIFNTNIYQLDLSYHYCSIEDYTEQVESKQNKEKEVLDDL